MVAMASPPGNEGVVSAPVRILGSIGQVRVGEVEGLNDNQLGPDALVGLATLALLVCALVALSFCSQQ